MGHRSTNDGIFTDIFDYRKIRLIHQIPMGGDFIVPKKGWINGILTWIHRDDGRYHYDIYGICVVAYS